MQSPDDAPLFPPPPPPSDFGPFLPTPDSELQGVNGQMTTGGSGSDILPPPVVGPTLSAPVAMPEPANKPKKKLGPIATAIAVLAAKAKTALAFVLPALKFLKLGKLLLTSGTMLISIWFYSLFFGWWFAVGFVFLIFLHELGHVFVAWKQGLPISAPIFLPGMGAIILSKRMSKTKFDGAVMGIGGPVAGGLSSLACYGIYLATQNPFYLALAYLGFFMNLFNMVPMFPLDGGWIVAAVSPILWVVGLVILVGMAVTGNLRNPLIYVLVVMSLPKLWTEWQNIRAKVPNETPPKLRLVAGASYVLWTGFLAIGMMMTHEQAAPIFHDFKKGGASPTRRVVSQPAAMLPQSRAQTASKA